TLRALAAWQGTKVDQFRDEEPGKILHEIRYGEMTAFTERPHSPYFGAADVTPLFIVLLDELERWTGDRGLVEELEMEAKAALLWIDDYGDRNGDGYVEYERHMKTGLENQCWKDSWNSILFADGSLSKLPRSTCEIQGYVYDAKVRTARLARNFWNDPALAERLERDAAELKARVAATPSAITRARYGRTTTASSSLALLDTGTEMRPRGSPWPSSTRRPTSMGVCQRPSRATAAILRASRSSIRLRAARRPGR